MLDHVPFDIQSEIMKRLPVKSLIQFRSVSKRWKCFIDNPKFIKNYHINQTNPQHHLLVRYELGSVQTYTSIVDNNTNFPQQKFPLTAPEFLSILIHSSQLSSVDGLLCFCGYTDMKLRSILVVIWNPTLRKSVNIVIPKASNMGTIIGFGVCPDTSDPKLLKISYSSKPSRWEVDVFTLSTRVWKTVFTGTPFKSCDILQWWQVFVNGVIYIRADNDTLLKDGSRFNYVISFDFKSEKFGEVRLPQRLVHTPLLEVTKVNESLGLLEYYNEGDMRVCGVWTTEDGANKPFTKIYTVEVEGKSVLRRVLGFRNNGEVVIELDDDNEESSIEVYEPASRHTNGVGINGKRLTFSASARSYMETLLLLNESDSIIHCQR